jgi:hypothetical protein
VTDVSQVQLPRFASLTDATMSVPQAKSRLSRFFLAPFADVDERVARLAAADRAEREARADFTSGVAGSRRS